MSKLFLFPLERMESAPLHLLERLREWKRRNSVTDEDRIEYWIVLDTDHHFSGNHAIGTHDVISEAARCDINVVVSNPRIELWLLLHFEDVSDDDIEELVPKGGCERRLRPYLPGYSHSSYNPTPLTSGLGDAIRRAEARDTTPNERNPPPLVTRFYRLMKAILSDD